MHYSETVGSWVLTRYDDCWQVLTGTKTFLTTDAEWFDATMPDWRRSPAMVLTFNLLPFRNPPDHTRLRRLLAGDFTMRRVLNLRPRVEAALDAVLDRLEAADGTVVNFQEVVAKPLTIAVISDLVGVPAEDRHLFEFLGLVMSRARQPQATDKERAQADEVAADIQRYFRDLIAQRRAGPRDDLTSTLVAVRDDDNDRLSESELLFMLTTLFIAGFETTAVTIGNGLHALLRDRDQFTLLRADPSLAAPAAEEMLRCHSSVAFQPRHCVVDVEIGGVTIPAGSRVLVGISAASRDPARFRDPDRFDITRDEGRSLAFGTGIHSCLGAALARLELTLLLHRLAPRFPRLECAGPPVVRPSTFSRGVLDLPVLVHAR